MFNKANHWIRIFVFLLILLGMWMYLNRVFATKDRYVNTAQGFVSLSKSSQIDILLLGSSHMYTAINPMVLNNQTKTLSYNLGSDGLRLEFTSMVLEEALRHTQPKLVIVEIFRGSLLPVETDQSKGFQLRALDFASNLNGRKFDLVRQTFDPKEWSGVYSPLVRNHENWASVNYLNLDRKDQLETQYTTFYDGFLGSFNFTSIEDRQNFKDFDTKLPTRDNSTDYISDRHLEEFERLATLAKKHDFKVLILTNPDLRSTSLNNHLYDQIEELSGSFGFPYLNLNRHYDKINLTFDDFKDPAHLNFFGAHKASLVLADFINKEFELPNRSQDLSWINKNQMYTAYINQIEGGQTIYKDKRDDTLHDQIVLRHLEIKQSALGLQFHLAFDPTTAAQVNDRYRIGIQVFPTEESMNQLGEFSQKSARKFDNISGVLEDVSQTLTLKLKTKIRDIERIRVFVFDKEKYSGTLGTPLIISGKNLDLD